MKQFLRVIVFATLLVVVATSAGIPRAKAVALTNGFTVTQNVIGTDTTPPSIPQNVVASPISQTEVDLAWDPSTDNVSVLGYQIFRNAVQVATTSSTTYADTGLTPATSYDYTIRAFDTSANFSTSSATTTGTTNATPTTQASPGGNASVPMTPTLLDFKIVVTETAADLFWRTTIPTRTIVSWGRTQDYESASLSEDKFLSNHRTLIENLSPGTHYFFKITAHDKDGQVTVLKEDSFTTLTLPDTEAPPNVHDFRGIIEGSDSVLSWKNPSVPDFAKVRIVRSDIGYPRDPFDGTLIYEGRGELFRDHGVFSGDSVTYYTIFAYDALGNESSGAVLRLEKNRGGITTTPKEVPAEATGTPTVLRFEDLIFEQDGQRVTFLGTGVPLDSTKPFTIKLPYERLPEHLKTILVTFAHPDDSDLTFSFLLRANKDKSAYQATIDSLDTEGKYALSLSVLDYKERTITKVAGSLDARARTAVAEKQHMLGFIGFLTESMKHNPGLLIIVLLLFLIGVYFAQKEKKEKEDSARAPLK